MISVLFILILFLLISLFLFILGLVRTLLVQNDSNQKNFLKGKAPKGIDGFLKGNTGGFKTNWIGKTFFAKTSTGINNFRENGGEEQRFIFKTYIDKGLRDKSIEVLKIDYDMKENPWSVRMILDELVETRESEYLGKIHIRIFPGISFAVGYFKLEKIGK